MVHDIKEKSHVKTTRLARFRLQLIQIKTTVGVVSLTHCTSGTDNIVAESSAELHTIP